MVTAHLYITSLIQFFLNFECHSRLPLPSKHGCRHYVCDDIMIFDRYIAENVYFGYGGTNYWFCDILITPRLLICASGGLSETYSVKKIL